MAGLATAAAGAVPRAAAQPPGVPADARQRALSFLDAMLDAHQVSGALRLPQSYSDQVGLYTTAYVYDAALAVLAYLADDLAASADRALLIGQSLVYAQQHDPQYSDGRIRTAYTVGPYTRGGVEQPDGFVRPDGSVNIGGAFGFTGSGTGEISWAGLALCALHERTDDRRYLDGAVRLGEWIVGNCTSAGPLGGFTAGVDRNGTPIPTVTTAHNASMSALFTRLAGLTGDRTWLTHSVAAARFVAGMWNPVLEVFHSGTLDGATIDVSSVRLESQTQSWLAVGTPDNVGCLDSVARQLTVTDTTARPNSALTGQQTFTGATVSSASITADPNTPIEPGLPGPDPDAVWLEGTAQYAAALYHSPLGTLDAVTQLQTLTAAQARLGNGQTVADQPIAAGGLVAATSPLDLGFTASGYYPALHTGATAWFLLAAAGVNPLR